MSDEFDALYEEDTNASLPKKLRAKIDELAAEVKDLRTENQQFKGIQRQQTLTELLTASGLNPGVAKFVPTDLDPTTEALGGWLSENASLFAGAGNAGGGQTAEPKPEASPDERKMFDFEGSADQSVTVSSDFDAAISGAKTTADIQKIWAQHFGR